MLDPDGDFLGGGSDRLLYLHWKKMNAAVFLAENVSIVPLQLNFVEQTLQIKPFLRVARRIKFRKETLVDILKMNNRMMRILILLILINVNYY